MRRAGMLDDERSVRVLIAAAAGVLAAWFVYFPLVNTDIWWHLAAGREIVARGGFLFTDPFSYTLEHSRWIDVHWLFQVMVYGLMRLAGPWGLVIAKSLIVGGACMVLCLVKRSVSYAIVTGLTGALFIYEARHLVLMRPVVVTLACLALYLLALERYREGGKVRWLVWLPLVQVVWTNSQGLFALGPVLAGCYLAGAVVERLRGRSGSRRGRRDPVVVLSLCWVTLVAVSFVNPYGYEAVALPLKLFARISPADSNVFSRNISENVPLLALRGADTRYVYTVSVVTAIMILVGYVARRRVAAAHLFVWAGFLALAYMAKRNVLLYLFVAAPLTGMYADRVHDALRGLERRGVRGAVRVVLVVAGALLVLDGVRHARSVAAYPRARALAPFRYPLEAVAYLKREPVEGRLFNVDRHGGYLLWELYPERQVFIDGRLVIRPPAYFAEYLAIVRRPERYFEAVAAKFGITQAVLPTAYQRAYMPLVYWLYQAPGWELAFTDGASVVFVRDTLHRGEGLALGDEACRDSLRAAVERRWANDDEIREEAVLLVERLIEELTADGATTPPFSRE